MRIVLYGNGAGGNHGCEAIVRGTAALLGEKNEYILNSGNPQEDHRYGLDEIVKIKQAKVEPSRNVDFYLAYLRMKVLHDYNAVDCLSYWPIIKRTKNVDLALSVGGDNYCYGNPGFYAYLNKYYNKKSIPTILWGCSIEPDVIKDKKVIKDLNRYKLVVTRENITYSAIKEVCKHVICAPDPAFFMESEKCIIDDRFQNGNVVGINVSPMVISNETEKGIVFKNYCNLIEYILQNTNDVIALIPHVVWENNDDRSVLGALYDKFAEYRDRLIFVSDHSAPQLKYIISCCKFFIGARTHATIAAYSSCVPTLVVGYSVKAKGIARDLFGTDARYVISAQKLCTEKELLDAYLALEDRRIEIKEHLEQFIPEYINIGRHTIRNQFCEQMIDNC